MKKYVEKLNSTKPYAQTLIFVLSILFMFGVPIIEGIPVYYPRLILTLIVIFSLVALEKLNPVVVIFAVISIFLSWISDILDYDLLQLISEICLNVFLFWMVITSVRSMMRIKEVFPSHLLEAINGFLLLAIAFTSLAFVLQIHFPQSFISTQGVKTGHDMMYYTVVTLTTTGYGDILPSTRAAKNLAAIMAISGQFYLTIILAIIVGKFANQK